MSARLKRVIAAGLSILSPQDRDAPQLSCGLDCQGVLQCVRQVSPALTACCSCMPVTASLARGCCFTLGERLIQTRGAPG
ncbi:hypothetical protein L207DRAFT_233872 [Hyaloscypha variabilis F]|uniref:Uncharacterized protein n=1 Tax=Hyaloscypha variabilis (strain UAMH 11265 / GT02V1 / F) TaxID=1149755 RepID=A0A2J6QU42_HYAVF|nr:hypothetical protein L207DRAFT_233872 [Hyaloscypha variabilis F]